MSRTKAATLILASLLAGCAVGPNYRTPPLAANDGYAVPSMAAAAGDDAETQQFVLGQATPHAWWTALGSPILDDLVRQALAQSPSLRAQQATLRAAKDALRAAQGGLLPTVSVGANRTWERYSSIPGAAGSVYSVTTAQVNVGYTLDLFGGQRRAVEGVRAQLDYARYEEIAAANTLSAEVVTTAIQRAALRDQIAATKEMIAADNQKLSLIQDQVVAGSVGRSDLLAVKSHEESLQTTLAWLEQDLDTARHLLAILIGRSPGEAADTDLRLADLTLPRDLPVSLPASLVAQRPDVRARSALLHQASAQIGVADANMLPQLNLSGDYASNLWSVTAAAWQPVFMGGALRAQRKQALDAFESARDDYRATVLTAFQNVADVLTALQHDQVAAQSARAALNDAQGQLDLAKMRYAAGTVSVTNLLAQTQQYQQASIASIQAYTSRYADTVALFQALGGGW